MSINFIIFPDWKQPEEILFQELAFVFNRFSSHPARNSITLFIDSSDITDNDANIILSSILTYLILEEGFDPDKSPQIYLIPDINQSEWDNLLQSIHARIFLEHDNKTTSILGNYYCPVCNNRVINFIPLPNYYFQQSKKYGRKYKIEDSETLNFNNYSCPFCNASDRDRLYAIYLREYLQKMNENENINILDFAPSYSLSSFIKNCISNSNKKIAYRTADIAMSGVDDKVDITDMKIYDNSSIDFFVCSHVLEHIPDDKKALSELYRILKPGGKGILMVPIMLSVKEIDEDPSVTDIAERWRRFGQDDHVRQYSKKGFLHRIKEAEFLIHQLGIDFFGQDIFNKHGITQKSMLYVVEKTN